MDFFNKLGKTISSKTQDVVRSTKDFVEITRLNSLISDENQKIENLYSQIGKLYYGSFLSGSKDYRELDNLCHEIDASNERIAQLNDQILQIKGVKKCSYCGAEIPYGSVFCGSCGKSIAEQQEPETPQVTDAPTRLCTNCGAELAEGVAFCTNCGQEVEEMNE